METRMWVMIVVTLLIVSIVLIAIRHIEIVSNDTDDIDVLVHEAKVATKNYIAALNDATGLIKASYSCTVSMKRSRYASRFIRARQRSTPLRNGIRALKNRADQLRTNSQSL